MTHMEALVMVPADACVGPPGRDRRAARPDRVRPKEALMRVVTAKQGLDGGWALTAWPRSRRISYLPGRPLR